MASTLAPAASSDSPATPERAAELAENLAEIRQRVQTASGSRPALEGRAPLLVAVSKYKPAADILACYEQGQRDFGENYVQELAAKANELPLDIRWHFIGKLQTNKSKILALIPNLYAMQTLSSSKAADALNRDLSAERSNPLNILLQVNTSGERSKSGLPPLPDSGAEDTSGLVSVAQHVINNCPRLRLQGLMTIGSLSESLSGADESRDFENRDFEKLKSTRDCLEQRLKVIYPDGDKWGENGRLLLSMGMSSDFEAALKSGSDIVRVGTGIFGQRHEKGEK